jgi:hypothetical protein
MTIPRFTGDENKDEINPMEWLSLIKEYDRNPLTTRIYSFGEDQKYWMSIDKVTKWNLTWEKFETLNLLK